MGRKVLDERLDFWQWIASSPNAGFLPEKLFRGRAKDNRQLFANNMLLFLLFFVLFIFENFRGGKNVLGEGKRCPHCPPLAESHTVVRSNSKLESFVFSVLYNFLGLRTMLSLC